MKVERHCLQMLEEQWKYHKFLCVGIDPVFEIAQQMFPNHSVTDTLFLFCRWIIDCTKLIACAYKFNLGFFLGLGSHGVKALEMAIDYATRIAPEVPVILDSKTQDIGTSNEAYARMFDAFGIDAITVHTYLGGGTLEPFLKREDKCIFALCRTSNSDAGELQDIRRDNDRTAIYQVVAQKAATEWNRYGNLGLVAGATHPDELRIIRSIAPNLPLLLPGVGTQGADMLKTIEAGGDRILINVSSGLLKNGKDGIQQLAQQFHDSINSCRQQLQYVG